MPNLFELGRVRIIACSSYRESTVCTVQCAEHSYSFSSWRIEPSSTDSRGVRRFYQRHLVNWIEWNIFLADYRWPFIERRSVENSVCYLGHPCSSESLFPLFNFFSFHYFFISFHFIISCHFISYHFIFSHDFIISHHFFSLFHVISYNIDVPNLVSNSCPFPPHEENHEG